MIPTILRFSYGLILIIPTVFTYVCNNTCSEFRPIDGLVKDECSRRNFIMKDNCCFNTSSKNIFGIDLRNCGSIKNLNIFHEDDRFLYDETYIIDLTENDQIVSANGSDSVWAGFINLNKLYLPSSSFQQCPGGAQFWDETSLNDSILSCSGQLQACNISAISCPSNSECKNDGPGRPLCRCEDGFYGYKCRKTGTFPSIMYFSVLLVSTVALTVGLWFVERRLVLKHAKTN